jgi:hypothetical protein
VTGLDERPFRRVLRWYSRAWRRRHGEVVLSTLLDVAAADGRTAPTAAETRRAALHGTADRLGRRFALVTALAAVAAAVTVGILWTVVTTGDLALVLLAGVIPALASASIVATARLRAWASDGEALAILTTGTAAWTLNGLASLAWSWGFDAADDGRPVVGLAAVWLPVVAAAGVVGAVCLGLAIWVLLGHTTRLGIVARAAIGGAAGLVLAPVLGLSTLSPAVGALLAAGALLFVLLPQRSAARGTAHAGLATHAVAAASVVPHVPVALDPLRRAASRGLAWLATAGGMVGVAYALTGATWSPGAGDATVAMAQGITLLLMSTLPLLAAFGLSRAEAPTRIAGLSRWGPLALVALAMSCVAAAYVRAPDSEDMEPGMYAGATLIGAALAWAVAARVRLPRVSAVTVGVAVGALFASSLGVMVVPMLVFGTPVAGLVLALRAGRAPALPRATSMVSGDPAPVA